MQETQVQSLGWEDPLKKDMATHSSILAWKNPKDTGAWWAAVHGVAESGMTEWLTLTYNTFVFIAYAKKEFSMVFLFVGLVIFQKRCGS